MWTLAVVVLHIFAEHLQEMALVQHDQVVEALPAERPDDALGHRVGVWGLHRGHDRRDPHACDVLNLAPGDASLFDIDGSALVIHADPDDEVTDPAGNSGPRIACGVLGVGPAHGADGLLFVNEPVATQAMFREVWGDYAPEQWALEHNAETSM
jgi:Copper/zinc superoxide dismutase (SODC)